MPATVSYTPNSQPAPTLQKKNKLHKSGFHLHPRSPPRRILSKRILSGGSISFVLGSLSSLYDTSSPDIIEVPAEVIGDYIAWEDLQAFEHDEFEKELKQKVSNKKEYEMPELTHMMGATVTRARAQPMKSKGSFPDTLSRPVRKLTDVMDELDTRLSENHLPASSEENHSDKDKRARGRPRETNQKFGSVIRPGTKLKIVEDSQQTSSESQLYESSNESHGR